MSVVWHFDFGAFLCTDPLAQNLNFFLAKFTLLVDRGSDWPLKSLICRLEVDLMIFLIAEDQNVIIEEYWVRLVFKDIFYSTLENFMSRNLS